MSIIFAAAILAPPLFLIAFEIGRVAAALRERDR